MLRAKRFFLFFVISGFPFFSNAASMSEGIKIFDCLMTVHEDNSMTVVEKITVFAAGHAIKRGIMREFPTNYKTNFWFNFTMGFDLKSVTMNGKPVDHRMESYLFGKRIYIGNPEIFLPRGLYTFGMTYHVTWACAFFKDQDELYWNVTGNGWRLDIDYVRARVIVPSGVSREAIKHAAYTGYAGSTGKDFKSTHNADGSVEFETTQRLLQGQGLTIVVGWPKGYVAQPNWFMYVTHFIHDNIEVLILFILFIMLIIYLLFLYITQCCTYAHSTIIPRFDAPEGLSPGSLYYIKNFGYGNQALTAEIVEMARLGYVKIENKYDYFWTNEYYLHDALTLDHLVAHTPHELFYNELHASLFKEDQPVVRLSNENHDIFENISTASKLYYIKNFDEKYFIFITEKMYIALLVSGLCALWPVVSLCMREDFFYPILLGCLLVPLIFIFNKVLKTYTHAGQRVVDHIKGFKMFLETTEKERLKIIGTQPTKTPELYEAYLPYAIALNVEEAWTRQFDAVFARMDVQGKTYTPLWYIGHGRMFSAGGFAHGFTSSMSAASTSPSRGTLSSSSGFGGGSSGGGRGGGGGGGW